MSSLIVVLAACTAVAPLATARADDSAMPCDCGSMQDPLGMLDDCITHHYDAGEILSPGVYESLLALAAAAQDAASRGDIVAAISILQAFRTEVDALSGKLIVGNALHLSMHADMAIAQLSGS